MELILSTPIEELVPKLIAFNNKELIQQLKPQLERYKGLVYSQTEVSQAKVDRATLNKLKDAIEEERKRIKKTYLVPYQKFEAQVKEITALIDESTQVIDSQIKDYDNQRREKKYAEIINFWNKNIGDLAVLIPIEKAFKEQWLNATYSMPKVEDEITIFIAKVKQELEAINSLKFKQETQLKDFYLRTLDLTATLQEKLRIEEYEKNLAEFKQKQAQAQPEEQLYQVDFRVHATKKQLQEIKEFLIKNNIEYGNVPQEKEI